MKIKNLDLFGGETEIKTSITIKDRMGYRDATDERRCKNCRYLLRKNHRSTGYYKCRWIGCSACQSSDVQLKRVCNKFEKDAEIDRLRL